jgi:hypothetical protein
MATRLKIEKRGNEIIPLEMHFFVTHFLVTQIIKGKRLYILVGSRDHRTQFWKGAIQGSFHKSLIAIGPVVSEKIFM